MSDTLLVMTVSAGKLETMGDSTKSLKTVEFSVDGLSELRAFYKKNKVRKVLCSSSCDFPEDDGAPDIDVRGFISEALAWKNKK